MSLTCNQKQNMANIMSMNKDGSKKSHYSKVAIIHNIWRTS